MDVSELKDKANLPLILYINEGKVLYVSNEINETTLKSNFPTILKVWKKG